MSKLRLCEVGAEERAFSCAVCRDVPLSVTVGSRPVRSPLYWRLVDPAFCLVEVGLDPTSGQIARFAVVNYNGEVAFGRTPTKPVRRQPGTPRFDLSPWVADMEPGEHPRFRDYPGRCQLRRADRAICVQLFDGETDLEVVMGERLVFAFNAARELLSLGVTE